MTIPRLERVAVARAGPGAAAPCAFPEPAKQVQERLSPAARAFLDHVEAHPGLLERQTFAPVYDCMRRIVDHPLAMSREHYGVQPWPVLFSGERWAELEWAAAGLDRIVRSLPRRVFADDPQAIADFYGLESAGMAEILLAEPSGLAETICRGDFVDTPGGLRCLEWNAGNLGAWQIPGVAPCLARTAEYAPFFAAHGGVPSWVDTPRRLMRHAVAGCLARPGLVDRELNVLVVAGSGGFGPAAHPVELYRRGVREALAELAPGLAGDAGVATPAEVDSWSPPRLGGRRFHAVVEQQNDDLNPPGLYRSFKAGEVLLLTGPATLLLADKRNLALLSEHAGSALFTPEERRLIETVVPWTRRLRPGVAVRGGEEVDLERCARTGRAELVLKKGLSVGGRAVVLGPEIAEPAWQQAVDVALAEGDWVVQEAVELLPYAFQTGAAGWAPHRAIWGMFAFAGEPAGMLVRMAARDRDPVVNIVQGAEYGLAYTLG